MGQRLQNNRIIIKLRNAYLLHHVMKIDNKNYHVIHKILIPRSFYFKKTKNSSKELEWLSKLSTYTMNRYSIFE